jgi:hypothetical protein
MLATLNAVAAVIITLGGGALGWERYHQQGASGAIVGFLFGLLVGFVVAAITCGTLATLILIENHLRNLLEVVDPPRKEKH